MKTLRNSGTGWGDPSHRAQKRGHPTAYFILDPRRRSLARATSLVLLSFFIAAALSDFPHNRANPYILIPTLVAFVGTADTIRCIRRKWSFYHGGVLLLIYMDLMALAMILFFLLYPYALWISASR